jgi:hypothetical protein
VACALLTPRLHRIGDNAAAISLILWYLAGIFFTTFMFGLQTQSHAFFVLSGVMLFLFGVENWRLFLFWLAVIVAEMIIVLNYAPPVGVVTDPRLLHSMGMQSMITAVTINAIVIFYVLFVSCCAGPKLKCSASGRAPMRWYRPCCRTRLPLGCARSRRNASPTVSSRRRSCLPTLKASRRRRTASRRRK